MQLSGMMRIHVFGGVTLSTALTLLLPMTNACAALGDSTAATSAAANPAPVTLLNGAVHMRTRVDAGGTTIREYASSTDQIFAYTWQGPTVPDLPALLGAYNASWRAGAASASAAGQEDLHASRVARSDVIVESGGQMRSYVGRAWLPAALPAGVTSADLP
jgi:Protein of unknown function (DUF2844)